MLDSLFTKLSCVDMDATVPQYTAYPIPKKNLNQSHVSEIKATSATVFLILKSERLLK